MESFSRSVNPSGSVCSLLQEVPVSVDRQADEFLDLVRSYDWVASHPVGVVVQLFFMAFCRVLTTQSQEQRAFIESLQ